MLKIFLYNFETYNSKTLASLATSACYFYLNLHAVQFIDKVSHRKFRGKSHQLSLTLRCISTTRSLVDGRDCAVCKNLIRIAGKSLMKMNYLQCRGNWKLSLSQNSVENQLRKRSEKKNCQICLVCSARVSVLRSRIAWEFEDWRKNSKRNKKAVEENTRIISRNTTKYTKKNRKSHIVLLSRSLQWSCDVVVQATNKAERERLPKRK